MTEYFKIKYCRNCMFYTICFACDRFDLEKCIIFNEFFSKIFKEANENDKKEGEVG